MPVGKHLTTAEAAKRLGVNPSRISQFVTEERLEVAARVGTTMFFLPEEIARFAKVPRKTGRPKENGHSPQRPKKSA